jgi:hypothetical protein
VDSIRQEPASHDAKALHYDNLVVAYIAPRLGTVRNTNTCNAVFEGLCIRRELIIELIVIRFVFQLDYIHCNKLWLFWFHVYLLWVYLYFYTLYYRFGVASACLTSSKHDFNPYQHHLILSSNVILPSPSLLLVHCVTLSPFQTHCNVMQCDVIQMSTIQCKCWSLIFEPSIQCWGRCQNQGLQTQTKPGIAPVHLFINMLSPSPVPSILLVCCLGYSISCLNESVHWTCHIFKSRKAQRLSCSTFPCFVSTALYHIILHCSLMVVNSNSSIGLPSTPPGVAAFTVHWTSPEPHRWYSISAYVGLF